MGRRGGAGCYQASSHDELPQHCAPLLGLHRPNPCSCPPRRTLEGGRWAELSAEEKAGWSRRWLFGLRPWESTINTGQAAVPTGLRVVRQRPRGPQQHTLPRRKVCQAERLRAGPLLALWGLLEQGWGDCKPYLAMPLPCPSPCSQPGAPGDRPAHQGHGSPASPGSPRQRGPRNPCFCVQYCFRVGIKPLGEGGPKNPGV